MARKRTGFINIPLPDKDNRLRDDVGRIDEAFQGIDNEFQNQHLANLLGEPSLARHLRKRKHIEEVSEEQLIQNTQDLKAYVQQSLVNIDQATDENIQDINNQADAKVAELQALTLTKQNELINSDFQIAQRGSSFQFQNTSKYGYTLDRWFFRTNASVFNFQINKSTQLDIISNVTSNGSVNQFGQFIPFLSKYKGKNISISLKLKANKILSTTVTTKAIISSSEEIQVSQDAINIGTSYSIIKIEGKAINYSAVGSENNESSLFIALDLPSDSYIINIEWIKVEVADFCTYFVSRQYQKELADCKFFYMIQNFLKRAVQANLYSIDFQDMFKSPNVVVYSGYDMAGSLGKVTNIDINSLEYVVLSIQKVRTLIEKLTLQGYASADSYYKGSLVLDSEIYFFTI